MIKNVINFIFSYGKQKIEDIEYHRNGVDIRDRSQYLEDLDNL